MMYTRNDLTLSMFYASSADADGNKSAVLTVLVLDADSKTVQSSQLQCVTDAPGEKTYSVGKQSIAWGSEPLLVAIENYWRDNPESAIQALTEEVMDLIAGNISQSSTWVGQYGMKVFEGASLAEHLPESVLATDGATPAG